MLFDPNWKPKTAEVDEVGDLMLRAADYLETHRWCQCEYVSRNGSVCLVGSLIRSEKDNKMPSNDVIFDLNGKDIFIEMFPLTAGAVARAHKFLGIDPMDFNDERGRKKIEIVTALREAAKLK